MHRNRATNIRGLEINTKLSFPPNLPCIDPIPAYAQKLLVMLVEFAYIKISNILHQNNTVSQCFEFLLGDLSRANVNNVKLCLAFALASAPEMVSQLKVVRKIGNLLEFVNAKDMEDFLEPTLSLCRAFLLQSLGNKKGLSSNYTKEPTLLSETSFTFHRNVRIVSRFKVEIVTLLRVLGGIFPIKIIAEKKISKKPASH